MWADTTSYENSPVDLADPGAVELVRKHRSVLSSTADFIQRQDVDCVVTLTRKGPRILELMHAADIWTPETEVVTEMSLDFIPKDVLADRNVLAFDDTVITGSTMHKLRKRLGDDHGANVTTRTLAIDTDTIALDEDTVSYRRGFNRSKRFEFSRDIVRSTTHLNKAYDVDYAFFYAENAPGSIAELTSRESVHEITTLNQRRNGFSRHSFRLEGTRFEGLLYRILDEDSVDLDIEKIRVYYDENTGKTTFVPIVLFSIDVDAAGVGVFDERFGFLDDLLDEARGYLSADDEEMAMYRLVTYLVSALYGIAFRLEFLEDDADLLSFSSPSDALWSQDVRYLFGPYVTPRILSVLDDDYERIVDALREAMDTQAGEPTVPLADDDEEERPRELDGLQRDVRDRITDYLEDHVKPNRNYSNLLATVFEGIYTRLEIPRQRNLRKVWERHGHNSQKVHEWLEEGNSWLETGFDADQLVEILAEYDADVSDSAAFSLAIDFLVDKGIVVPQFYERTVEDGPNRLERVFRHGENCLDNKGYSYLVDSTVDMLFSTLEQKSDDDSFNRVPFEKTGVLIHSKLRDYDTWDDVDGRTVFDALSVPGGTASPDGTVSVGPEYFRHGKILRVGNSAEKYRPLFTDWCEEEGIVRTETGESGVMRSKEWDGENPKIDEERVGIEGGEISSFENLPQLIFEIEHAIDDGTGDYLTAITTCRSREETLRAMRAELQLFFQHPDFKFEDPLGMALDCKNRYGSRVLDRELIAPDSPVFAALADDLDDCLTVLNGGDTNEGPLPAINGVGHKKDLRDDLDDIVEEIHRHFDNHNNLSLGGLYNENLREYLENIRTEDVPKRPEHARVLWEKVVFFGHLCTALATVSQKLLELSKDVAIGKDENTLRSTARELNRALSEWESCVTDDRSLWRFSSPDLEEIDLAGVDVDYLDPAHRHGELEGLQERRTAVRLLTEGMPQIDDAYAALSIIYHEVFSDLVWDDEIDDLFYDRDTEPPPYDWVIYYDVKGSSTTDDPTYKQKAEDFVDKANDFKLPTIRNRHDSRWEEHYDDSKHIFVEEPSGVLAYLNGLLDLAADHGVELRFGVCGVRDGELVRVKRNDKLKSEVAHALSKDLGEYLDDEGSAPDGYHSLVVHSQFVDEVEKSSLPGAINRFFERMEQPSEVTHSFDVRAEPVQFLVSKLVPSSR